MCCNKYCSDYCEPIRIQISSQTYDFDICDNCKKLLPLSWQSYCYIILDNSLEWFFNTINYKNQEIKNKILEKLLEEDKIAMEIIEEFATSKFSLIRVLIKDCINHCEKYKNQLEIEWQQKGIEETRKELVNEM